MGSYVIPGATRAGEAAAFIGAAPPERRVWLAMLEGVWFYDPLLTDAECAALYAGFTPTGGLEDGYEPPKPPAVQAAIDTLQAFYDANPSSVTDTQSATLHRAEVTILRYLNRGLE